MNETRRELTGLPRLSRGVEIYGRSHRAEVDSVVEHDSGRCERLLPCEWDAADFRWPNPIYEWRTSHAIACNVHVTGRTLQRRCGDYWVRVQFEWVGDGEPNTYSGGWLKV